MQAQYYKRTKPILLRCFECVMKKTNVSLFESINKSALGVGCCCVLLDSEVIAISQKEALLTIL